MSDKPKIVQIASKKKEPVTADEILEKAKGHLSSEMLVVGWGIEEGTWVFSSPCRSKETLVYLLEMAKLQLISGEL